MDLYYNGIKNSRLSVSPQTTIGEIKKVLSDWLVPQGITNYNIRLFLNDGNELDKVVFETNIYDSTNFETQKELMYGGSIHVIPQPTKQMFLPPEEEEEELDQKKNERRRRVKFSDTSTIINIPVVREREYYTEPACPKCNETRNTRYPCRKAYTVFDTKEEYDEYCELINARSTGEYHPDERKEHLSRLFNK